ncbi:class I SAM-dependent methyltransferase [Candidatus Woesearchaeota archaeon]|nr:class I SAM-dependent methyltransferase [Candidatus Woesearchaeota archaeon]
MKQAEFWKKKPVKELLKKTNIFAKRSLKLIKQRKLKTILDLGCGRSRDPVFFANNGLVVTALDVSKNRLETLKRQNIKNIKIVQQDIRNLKFPENSFDVIYAHLSTHYFDDKTTTKIFDKLYKILKKDGLFLVKCKSTDDVMYGKGKKIEDNFYILEGHARHFFDKDYMKDKLRKFKILKIRKSTSMYKRKSHFIEAAAAK